MADLNEQLSSSESSERAELERSYREVFATTEGKRVLFDIIELCAIYNSAFTGDNDATNFTLGMQEAGRKVIARLEELDPRFYPQLLLWRGEAKAMEKAAKRAATKGVNDDDLD